MRDLADQLARDLPGLEPHDRLVHLRKLVPGRIVFTTSFGIEDQALTEIVARSRLGIELATLDTGRLFPETYDVWARTQARYGLAIRALYPREEAAEGLVRDQGIDGFYRSVAARKACCTVRKVEPLGRALSGAAVWLTGLRADQSANRATTPIAAFDEGYGILKVNPLVDWTREDAVRFTAAFDVPVSALHDRGFLSIGCAPCTRAIRPGEPERAGRWWWEQEQDAASAIECGLHAAPDGTLVRARTEGVA